ncbi:hypothetical protein [Rubellicoccus peritrichatus]|uniref:Fibronectin type-III domain-containing protein n=1 Tax=Rubellicoccus peritrichatus TaxID=3080537 RepID=A0AAQ3L906_9BACT|nr:hypothetical protein [Puniceicoccus sp. CR14]WOO39505.1 hypothetical protein RZN69_12850 [Puniceicoccus sp. CR14]
MKTKLKAIISSLLSRSKFGLLAATTMAVTTSGIQAARGPMAGIDANSKFIVYYGDDYYLNTGSSDPSTWTLNYTTLNELILFDVVVLQPNQPHCTPEVVNYLKANGVDYVLGYISIGEDFQPYKDYFAGDGTGPVKLENGVLVPTNGGIASFYVDVDSQTLSVVAPYDEDTLPVGSDVISSITGITTTARFTPDGKPDLNPIFKGYMVNPDLAWRTLLNDMRIGGTTGMPNRTLKAGFAQLAGARPIASLQRDRTENFGFDGFFLDTIDTSGPFDQEGWYPWTIQEMTETVKYISDNYPTKTVYANRGGFYYQAGLKSNLTNEYPIDYTIRPYVNAFLFESYMYDSGPYPTEGQAEKTNGESEFFYDNKYNQMPKILAEANREDGFTVFTLEYAEERLGTVGSNISTALINLVVDEDIKGFGATTSLAAFRDLNTVDLGLPNVLPVAADTQAPTWNNTSIGFISTTAPEPTLTPRTGVQELAQGPHSGEVIVRWDVAQDQTNPITYNVYWNTTNNIATATKVAIPAASSGPAEGYNLNTGSHYANETILSGFTPGNSYYFWVRAEDALANEDTNIVAKSIVVSNPYKNTVSSPLTIDGDLADWAGLQAFPSDSADVAGTSLQNDILGMRFAHDTTNLYIGLEWEADASNTLPNWGQNLYLDTDNDIRTGFSDFGQWAIGADYLIQGAAIFSWDPTLNGTGNWVFTGVFATSSINTTTGVVELAVNLANLGNATSFRVMLAASAAFYGGSGTDYYPDTALTGGSSERYFTYEIFNSLAITNPVLNSFFTVDGLLTEWSSLTSYTTDPDDISVVSGAGNISGPGNQADWRKITVAHTTDSGQIYMAYENDTSIYISWGFQIFLDTDLDAGTGFSGAFGGINMPIGADYLIEGINVYEYNGTGTDFTWTDTGNDVGRIWVGNVGEVFFFNSWIGNPSAFRFFCFGNNEFYDHPGVYDFYPDEAASGKSFLYEVQ